MIDLTNITPAEANKLEMALLQLIPNIENKIASYERLSQDEDFSEQTRSTMSANANWWREVLKLIEGETK